MTALTHEWLDQFHRLGATDGHEFGLPPAAKLAQLIRPAIIARPGKVFVWCDWSAIEARVLPWLAASRGAEAVLDIFRTNDADPSLPDIYKINAGKLLGKAPQEVTDDERQSHGKVPVLSLGFGGGLGALQNMANNYRVYLDDATGKAMVDGWRDENKWARAFWGAHNSKESYGLWGAICSAVENRDTIYEAGRVAYVYDRDYLGGTMFCALPSGHMLSYPAIKWEKREVKDKKTGELVERWQLTFRRAYARKALWYGLACLAGGTLVATSRGWVRLDTVRADDLLWDGVRWVRHGGLICKGSKHTIPLDGVEMTSDHKVLTRDGWKKAQVCEGLQRRGVRLPDSLAAGTAGRTLKEFAMGLPLRVRRREDGSVRGLDQEEQGAFAAVVRLRSLAAYVAAHDHARDDQTPGVRGVALDAGPLPAADASGMEELRRPWHSGLSSMGALRDFLVRHGANLRAGADAGAQGQREGLRTGQLHMGDARGASDEPSQQSSCEHDGAVADAGHWPDHPALSVAPRLVYDILDAGPDARFVVLGDTGPIVVHNCENVTQATAAMLLRRTLVALRAEEDWMPVVGHTHDEVLTEVDEAEEASAKSVLMEYFLDGFEWTKGLPLAAEASSNWYYTKGKV